MDNFTNISGSICDSGSYASVDNSMNDLFFNSKIPQISNTITDNLLKVKKDLIDYLDDDILTIQDTKCSISNDIKKFIHKGKSLRDELIASEKKYEENREIVKNNLNKINAFLEFVNKLNNIPGENSKLIETSVNTLLEDVNEKDYIESLKNEYISSKKNYMSFLNELLHVNQINIGNKCGICFINIVSNYYNPCGHTICESCDKFDMNDSNNNRCPICRSNVNERRKLFFI